VDGEKATRRSTTSAALTPNIREWKHLNLNYQVVAHIHQDCASLSALLHSLLDGAHQCIHSTERRRARHERELPPWLKPNPAAHLDDADSKLDADALGRSSAVTPLERIPRVDEHHCVGCNLCALVCP